MGYRLTPGGTEKSPHPQKDTRVTAVDTLRFPTPTYAKYPKICPKFLPIFSIHNHGWKIFLKVVNKATECCPEILDTQPPRNSLNNTTKWGKFFSQNGGWSLDSRTQLTTPSAHTHTRTHVHACTQRQECASQSA